MDITFRGHMFFELKTKGKTIVIDPFTDNGLTKVKPADIKADLVLITHGHFDHVGCVDQLDVPVIAIHEIAHWLERKGKTEVTGMNIGGKVTWQGIDIWMTAAMHSGGLETEGETLGYGGSAYGFLIDDGETRFYISGDTGLFGDMKTVIGDILKPDVAALPIGDHFTMGPEHAAIAAKWLGVKTVIPCHYNTFPLIEQDPQDLVQACGATECSVAVMDVDATIRVKAGKVVQAATA